MTKLVTAVLALCAGTALLAAGLPGTAAKYATGITVPYTVTTHPKSWYFGYTDGPQSLTVPQTGYYAVQLWGADGGDGSRRHPSTVFAAGGAGAYLSAVLNFTEGDTLTVQVGGKGGDGDGAIDGQDLLYPGDGGYNGGGGGHAYYDYANDPNLYNPQAGGGGGGATDIRLNGDALANRVMVAGGGGGGGGGSQRVLSSAGGGGGGGTVTAATIDGVHGHFLPGIDGDYNQYMKPVGTPEAGGPGTGGAADGGGGGGGAGYYGGDGGCGSGGGGGGSSFISATATLGWQACAALTAQLPPPDDSQALYEAGDGYAIITYLGTTRPDDTQDPPTTSPGANGGAALGTPAPAGTPISSEMLLWPEDEETEVVQEESDSDENEPEEEFLPDEWNEPAKDEALEDSPSEPEWEEEALPEETP